MGEFSRNLRYSFRRLFKKPVFSLTIISILALGIGANSAIFSFVDALLLRPLPFPNPGHLVMVWMTIPQAGDRNEAAPADFEDWRRQSQAFDYLEAYRLWPVNLTHQGEPERILGAKVSAQFFQALDAEMLFGRAFLSEEEKAGNNRVVILSYSLWQRDFASRSDVVGQSLDLDGQEYLIVGVVAAGYEWPSAAEVWAPLVLSPAERVDRQAHTLSVLGRIKAQGSLNAAQAEMQTISSRLEQQYPLTNTGEKVNLVRLPGQYSDDVTDAFLFVLVAAVAFLLLIACSNSTSLLLADVTGRQREIATRLALGASRARILFQGLTETTLLSFLGAIVALGFAFWGVSLIRGSIPLDQIRFIPGWRQMHLTGRVFGFTLFVTVLVGLLGGLAAFLHISKLNVAEFIKEGTWSSSTGFRSLNFRSILLVAQFALTLILMVGTGLMTRVFAGLIDPHKQGFNSENVLTLRMRIPDFEHQSAHRVVDFYREVLVRTKELGGVKSASVISYLPFTGDLNLQIFSIEGHPAQKSSEAARAGVQAASADFFSVMQIPILKGRSFTEDDGEGSTPVAILSESTARRFWRKKDPIGERIQFNGTPLAGPWLRVVGIVGDVKQFMLDKVPQPAIYVPYAQMSQPTLLCLAVRTSGNPMNLFPNVRRQVSAIDHSVSLYQIKSMEQVIRDMLSGFRVANTLVSVCSVLALILASAGIYGTIAHSVAMRTREIGIRMALGAPRRTITRLFVMRALKLAVIGLAIGLPAALAISRFMSSMLFDVVGLDPLVFAAFTILLAGTALAAAYLPGRKATKGNPIAALRNG